MRRPQFTLRALLVAMLVVAAFFGGMATQAMVEAKRRAGADLFFEALRSGEPSRIYVGRDFPAGGGPLINDL